MNTFLRRLAVLIPTLIGVSFLTFSLMHITPGDPVKLMLGPEASDEAIEQKRKDLGFDKPFLIQYIHYVSNALQGDLGRSITTDRPVTEEIWDRLPATIELAIMAMFFASVTSISIGVISAVNPRSLIDSTTRIFVFVFLAMPGFWLGLELIIIFSRKLEWFPPAGRGDPFTPSMFGHLMLPAITLGVGTGAFLCRVLRSSMLEVLNMDFVRTAKAKGCMKTTVIMKHAFRNALIPFVTLAGISTGSLLGGSIVVEKVFNWPGIGSLLIQSIGERNLPVTLGCVLVISVMFVLVNLIVDILYVIIDPRIRVGTSEE
jgi:peptide/nickel transport system permease protein